MYPARLLGTSWKREHWYCRLWREGAVGDEYELLGFKCIAGYLVYEETGFRNCLGKHSTAPPTENLYEKQGLKLCDLWFVLPYCPTLRPTSVRVLLTTKITYGPIREYRRCFQFVDIHITVKHENERIKAAEPQQEKKFSSAFLGLKFSETRPELDLKAIKFVVNEKIL